MLALFRGNLNILAAVLLLLQPVAVRGALPAPDASAAAVIIKAHLTYACSKRLAWVLGFAMGPYGCMERTWKPFNPILGETFEIDLDRGVRFFAEQVLRWRSAWLIK